MTIDTKTKSIIDPPKIPDGPLLSQLAGMDAARAWGAALAKDLTLYKSKALDWSEIDRGCVLHGPPGTGKTTLARAIAATAKVPLIATSFADWTRGTRYAVDIINAMRKIFETAAAHSPCIVAIDELDSLPTRESLAGSQSGVHMIINALLEQLDGLNRRPGIVVIGTCNHPDRLDAALVRPGRLDRMIPIPLPTIAALPQIIAFHLGDDAKRMGDLSAIALRCVGMSGAAVEQFVRDARKHARAHGRILQRADLLAVGDAGSRSLDTATQWRIAVHEAGHAVAGYRLKIADRIDLSIVGREDTGGRVSFTLRNGPLTRSIVEHRIVMHLAGRAAEEVFLGEVSSGSGGSEGSDLAQATILAHEAIARLGLSSSGRLIWQARATIFADDEVDGMLREGYAQARRLIEDDWDFTNNVAIALMKHRALSHREFVLIDRRPRSSWAG